MSNSTRTWLVTGCSSGFGRALAEAILNAGDCVMATARTPAVLADLAGQFPDRCHTAALDVTDPAQVRAAVQGAMDAFGRIDVLVNNAGYAVAGALEELSEEEVAANFQTNFFGALAMIRAVLPGMRAQQSGHVVNISAAAAIANYPGFGAYGASKWALEGASEALAAEVAPLGIRVTLVEPGPFRTEFLGKSFRRAGKVLEPYERTSGKFVRLLEGMRGRQTGDPAKAAQAILAAVAAPQPPLRLVLGRYAHDKWRKKLAATEAEIAAWQSVGQPTEFDPPKA